MSEIDPIYAVYTPGKVATTTTHAALQSALETPVYNIRVGTSDGIATYVENFQKRFNRPLPTDELAFDRARQENPDARVRLVTLTREPVASAVSNWFFGFERNHPGVQAADWSLDQHREAIVAGQFAHRPDYFTGWLDFECGVLTGIDAYSKDFPTDAGYETYESATSDLLIIQAEQLSRVYRPAFQAFIGVDIPALENKNEGESLGYADVYRQFKASPALTNNFVDQQHDTKFAKHFYTAAALSAAREQWTATN